MKGTNMQLNNLQFEIQQEQNNRLVTAVEAFLISFFSIITALLLPQLLYQYLMKSESFDPSQTQLLQNIPTVAYGVAAFFFLYAIVVNLLRARRIRQLKQDLELMQYAFSEDDLSENSLLADALSEVEKQEPAKETKTSTKKSAPAKTVKKAAAPKKATKSRSSKK